MKIAEIIFSTLLILYHLNLVLTSDPLLVKTQKGYVRGYENVTPKGKTFYSYQGIPFGQPPVDKLRFKPPRPAKYWQGEHDGTKEPVPCLQYDFLNEGQSLGQEDCLVLSVHTPKPNEQEAYLPVMVFIHGGAFVFGSIKDYQPHPLMDQNIVLVQIQYRLGVLGFLSTGDKMMSGNYGLKDQTLALKWVNENIHKFGGDNLRVTLFGESAGAASVHYQILSPNSIGLFQRAIIQSGTALCPWALNSDVQSVSKFVGESVQCPTEEGTRALLKCLREKDGTELTLLAKDLQKLFIMPVLLGPTVFEDFLMKRPIELLKEGRHKRPDIIFGTNEYEGLFISTPVTAKKEDKMKLIENFDEYAPSLLNFDAEDELNKIQQTKNIFNKYTNQESFNEDKFHEFTKMMTDRHMLVCTELAARLHAVNMPGRKKNIYMYELRKRPLFSFNDIYQYKYDDNKTMSAHGDDIPYLFDMGAIWPKMEDEDNLKFRDIINTLWYNFADTGNPTPDDSLGFKWNTINATDFSYLVLQNEPKMEQNNRQEILDYWKTIPTKLNKILHPDQQTVKEVKDEL